MKRIIIIGAGIAGLSAGCYAMMNGYNVRIFEMHNLPGGLCTSWKRKKYLFDNCIHWLTGTTPASSSYHIWHELGIPRDMKYYYKEMSIKICLNGKQITLYNDPAKLRNYLTKLAPEDHRFINKLVDGLEKYYILDSLPIEKAKELCTFRDNLNEIKMMWPFLFMMLKNLTTHIDDFANKFHNLDIRRALQALKPLTPMDHFFVLLFLLGTKGESFPQGGSLKFAQYIEKRYLDLGGQIQYKSTVKKLIESQNRVTGIELDDGSKHHADIVISCADGYQTLFQMLEPKYVPKKLKKMYRTRKIFPSYIHVSIGVNLDLSNHPILKDSVYYIFPLKNPINIAGKEQHSIQIKNYSFDPTFAPPGKSTLSVSFFSEYSYWEDLYTDKTRYNQEKSKIRGLVVEALNEILPEIPPNIEVIDVSTPMTIVRYTGNWKGSIMGFMKSFTKTIPKQLPNLENFYMAGQWTGDTGIIGAAISGRNCIQILCKNEKKDFQSLIP